jgi:TolB-like protein/lipoprotein NlpI
MTQPRTFFSELKRRNVLRAAVLYLGGLWALTQGIAQLAPVVGAPDWVARVVLVAAAIGFPFWLAFAWYYEFTPQGLRRESEVPTQDSIAARTGRRLDFWIIAVLATAVVLLLADRFVWRRSAAPAPAKSIAVLPFVNTSGDPGNEYFSDGMSEELINALGRLQDLTVIGRSSSFQFKGRNADAQSIGAKLGVAYLLEGSVRKAEDKVRIAVELVNAANGADLWSETYDRDLNDIFAVQSDIAMQVASKLQATLLDRHGDGSARELKPDAPPSASVAAYNALLQGNFYLERRTDADLRRAIGFYQQATRLDPKYALAYARLAYARTDLDASFTPTSGDARATLRSDVHNALETSLALDPDSADAHIAQGYAMEVFDLNLPGAIDEYRRSLKLAPQNPMAALRLALTQSYLGQFDAAVDGYHRVLTLDPLSARARQYFAIMLTRMGRYDEAEAMLRKAIELQPQAGVQHAFLATTQMLAGRVADAIATAQAETDPFWRTYALALVHTVNGDHAEADAALQKLIAEDADDAGSQIAQVYALRKEPDEVFKWLEHAYETHDGGLQQMRLSAVLAPYEDDPRYQALARKLRLRGTPAPEPASP